MYETVVNAIHAIEEAGIDMSEGRIEVEVIRDAQSDIDLSKESRRGPDATPNIVGFRVSDNGVGFDEDNFESFKTLDSEHKIDKGCKGVGRLLWLKAFGGAMIVSRFRGSGMQERSFSFTAAQGVSSEKVRALGKEEPHKTTVTLYGFQARYRNATFRTVDTIARSLFEHCLWYFVREGNTPRIFVTDGSVA